MRPVVPTYCLIQGCYNSEFEAEIENTNKICCKYNQICPTERKALNDILKELLGKMG